VAVTILPLLLSSSTAPPENPPEIPCSCCGLTSIPAPEGATPTTHFTCRSCCASLLQSRDPSTADTFASMSAAIDARYWQETESVGHLGATSG
jgi:hypothetical protein